MAQAQKAESQEVAVATADPFMSMVERLASIPNLSAETVDRFLAMQERVMDREAKTAFYDAMNRVQAAIPSVMPNSRNDQTSSDYANLKAISSAIKPVYTKEGFSASFWQGKSEVEGNIRVEGVLRHRDGHSEPYSLELPPDKAGIAGKVNKTDVHAAGSTFTYGRRYLTCMMFDVAVGFDTDGNQPADTITEEQVATLQKLLDNVSDTDNDLFFKWAKIEALEDLPAKKFGTCVARLKEKQRAAD